MSGWFAKGIKDLAGVLRRENPTPSGPPEHVWSIGIYSGNNPFNLRPAAGIRNPVLTAAQVCDVPAVFVADPFMIQTAGTWYMFFEVMNQKSQRGEIGLATSVDGLKWTYRQIVLSETFHISYPYVFEWGGDYYMVPETFQAGGVRLYRASEFPARWTFVGNLLTGPYFADPSLVRFGSRWWIFSETSSQWDHDTLRVYFSEELSGPFTEHPGSPVISGNPHIARPAGRMLVLGDKVIRYAQDCKPVYGTQVRAFEICTLTPDLYREREVQGTPVLGPSGRGWNDSGMHHVDAHVQKDGSWLACVDGFRLHPRPGRGR
jgi:hypothetical protein